MLKPKIIFWDNDGTMVDTEHLYFKAGKIILAKEGIEIDEEFYTQNLVGNTEGIGGYARSLGFSEENIVSLRANRNDLYNSFLKEDISVLPHIPQVLQHFHKHLPMWVVTSCFSRHFQEIHKQTELLQYFDDYITGDMVEYTKPDPALYLRALEKSGFSAMDCVAIEDSAHGVSAAKSAGIPCIAIPHAFMKNHDFSAADVILKNAQELKDLIGI